MYLFRAGTSLFKIMKKNATGGFQLQVLSPHVFLSTKAKSCVALNRISLQMGPFPYRNSENYYESTVMSTLKNNTGAQHGKHIISVRRHPLSLGKGHRFLHRLGGANGFWQGSLEEENARLTTFIFFPPQRHHFIKLACGQWLPWRPLKDAHRTPERVGLKESIAYWFERGK